MKKTIVLIMLILLGSMNMVNAEMSLNEFKTQARYLGVPNHLLDIVAEMYFDNEFDYNGDGLSNLSDLALWANDWNGDNTREARDFLNMPVQQVITKTIIAPSTGSNIEENMRVR